MIQKSLRRPRSQNTPGPSTKGRKLEVRRWSRENELALHLSSSVDRFAELQFFLQFCQARSAKTVPRFRGWNGLADTPVAPGSSTPMKRSLGLRLESRGRGLLPALMSGACFSAGRRTGALMITRKATIIGGRTGVAGHRSHGCFRVRTEGAGLRFSPYFRMALPV